MSAARGLLLLAALALPATAGVAQSPAPEPAPDAVLAELAFLPDTTPGTVHVDLAPEDASRRLPLQLDTGAETSVMTRDLARSLGVRMRRLKGTPYRRATRLGRDLEFAVIEAAGGGEAGLLGGNFLGRYVVEVDYAARRVRFLDPDRFEVPARVDGADETVLPARIVANRPLVEVDVEGEPLEMLLDTGSRFGVILGVEAAEARGLRSRPAAGLRAVGRYGPLDVRFAELGELRLGSLRFADLPVLVARRGLHQQGGASDSVLGDDLLATCVLRIDYPRGRVWLRHRPGAGPRFLGADWTLVRRSGAVLYRRGDEVFVGVVLPDSPAAALGVEPGDVLADVHPGAEDFDPTRPHAQLAAGGPLRVRREDARGRARTLSLPVAPAPEPAVDAPEPADGAPAPG